MKNKKYIINIKKTAYAPSLAEALKMESKLPAEELSLREDNESAEDYTFLGF